MRLRWLPLVGLATLAGCHKKRPTAVDVKSDRAIASLVTITVGGQELPTLDQDGRSGFLWKVGEEPADLTVTASYETPCGRKTLTVKPTEESGEPEERRVQATIEPQVLNVVELSLDPALDGALALGDVPIPKPFPKTLRVPWADCPRQVTIAGKAVPIPAGDALLLARDEQRCFADGTALYGQLDTTRGCAPEASVTLMGKVAYPLTGGTRSFTFVPLDWTIETGTGAPCRNASYLQVCQAAEQRGVPLPPPAPAPGADPLAQ